jgi:hypothetical protein
MAANPETNPSNIRDRRRVAVPAATMLRCAWRYGRIAAPATRAQTTLLRVAWPVIPPRRAPHELLRGSGVQRFQRSEGQERRREDTTRNPMPPYRPPTGRQSRSAARSPHRGQRTALDQCCGAVPERRVSIRGHGHERKRAGVDAELVGTTGFREAVVHISVRSEGRSTPGPAGLR